MLYSTVSSHILKSISEVEGFNAIDTLTGFKWLGNKSHELLNDNKHVLFAFEEAMYVRNSSTYHELFVLVFQWIYV